MKKLVLLATIVATLTATSCKKDETCACTYGSKVSAQVKTSAELAATAAGTNSTVCTAIQSFSVGIADSTKVTCSLK